MWRGLSPVLVAAWVALGVPFGAAFCGAQAHAQARPFGAQAASHPEVEEALREEVRRQLPWPDARVEISDVRLFGTLGASGWQLRLRAGSPTHGAVQAEVVPAAATSRTPTFVRAQVEVFVPVFVAAQPLNAGDRAEGAVALEERSVARLPHGFVADLAQIDGQTARRAIRMGDVLTQGHFEAPVVIERQQLVTLLVRRGTVVVTGRGVAMQSARKGQVVRVQNVASNSVVTGIARESGVVEVP